MKPRFFIASLESVFTEKAGVFLILQLMYPTNIPRNCP
nr:MAG TPA: hypothetical protein [Caudoviricetes sp.]